ncbi:hypothetical protein LPC08_00650 [Roseomonas sp. OT10]|uniref:hypothetical protein n=1 Tax=Roseomonas cutis TaxID=2897332 RepID=UPI001E555419|nr:hypothetical protein [Roseomonas sp. OT10]UFN49189.1 hypothetical protein LPC08_00650 [Roseomonas sp. OT10]
MTQHHLPRRRLLRAGLALAPLGLGLAAPALGQPTGAAQPPTRLRGTIAAIAGDRMTVVTREGPSVEVALNDPLTVSALRRLALSDIAPNSYIGTAAAPGPDGQLQALEVLVFPEAMRGTGEGHFPWDLAPGSTMTNATVGATVEGRAGRELTLNYKGQSVQVRVPPEAPVVTLIPASRADLVPGAPVFLSATRNAAGQLATGRVTVGKDGVAPPM